MLIVNTLSNNYSSTRPPPVDGAHISRWDKKGEIFRAIRGTHPRDNLDVRNK